MARTLLISVLVLGVVPCFAQSDPPRVVTTSRIITKADVPDQTVYDNAMLLQPATFPGGDAALEAHFASILGAGAASSVTAEITFIVEEDGSVNEVRVNKGIGQEQDRSILRAALAMPAWSPAVVKDLPVRARVTRTVSIGS